MTGKIVAIVQARLGSSRLPLKSLLCLRGLPVIDWVMSRLRKSALLSGIIAAIPDTPLDRVLGQHLEARGYDYLAGPESDVLRRFVMAADATGADYVVRVCADNPLIWGEAIDRLIAFYAANECDYAWNHVPRDNMWPDGLGAEIISAPLLREIDRLATLPAQREHCLNYIRDNAENYRLATFNPAEAWLCRPELKLDLDSVADFERLALLPLAPDMDAAQIVAACDSGLGNPAL